MEGSQELLEDFVLDVGPEAAVGGPIALIKDEILLLLMQ